MNGIYLWLDVPRGMENGYGNSCFTSEKGWCCRVFFGGMFTTVTWINMDIGGSSKEGLQGVRARRRCQAVML